MTFQAIDTQLIIDQGNESAAKAGLTLNWVRGYKGMLQAYFGDKVQTDSGAVSPMLFLRNINDGGHALMIGVGMFRFVCANGLVVGDNFYSRRIIHRAGPTLDEFLGNLDKNLDAASETAASMDLAGMVEEYSTRQVTEQQGIEVLASGKDRFDSGDFDALERALVFQELWARIWREQMRSFFLDRIARRHGWTLDWLAHGRRGSLGWRGVTGLNR